CCVGILGQHQQRYDRREDQDRQIHPFPPYGSLALGSEMPPPISKSLCQATATANPGAIALTVKQNKNRNNDESQKQAPHHPNLMGVIKEGIEEERPSINDTVAAPGLLGEDRIVSEFLTHPLVFDCVLEKKFRNQEKENPLKAQKARVAPNLKLV